MTVIGILLGGAPAYVSLAMDAHAAITRRNVDTEISNLNAPIITFDLRFAGRGTRSHRRSA